MIKVLLLVPLIFLTACASTSDYYASVNHANETASKIELAKAQAEVERIRALQEISQNGGPTAQTAAVMSLTFAGQQNQSQQNQPRVTNPNQPKTGNDYALEWASVLIPGVTSLYGINRNAAVSMHSSDNQRKVTENTNETMLGFGRLQAGKEVPIVGNSDDVLLYPRNPADETIVGTEDDVLLFPTN